MRSNSANWAGPVSATVCAALAAALATIPAAAQQPGGGASAAGGQAPAAASAPAALSLPAATAPSLSSGTLPPSGNPAAGGPPPVVVQYPPATITANDGTTAPLYGSSLFTGAFAGATVTTQSDYQVQIGDTIEVKTFGNMSLDVVARVDATGKLFLPIIGPVTLAGVTRASLNATLQSAVGAVYTNTRVYADIVQPGSVGVYVSGPIQRPGRYLGATTDDLLYFLDKAGGIDGLRGSFRDVAVRHKDGREEHFDLYDFLGEGRTGPARFADGDTIVVQPRGPQVVVTGMALQPYAFELKLPPDVRPSPSVQAGFAGSVPGAGTQLLALARPNARLVTGAYVRSVRDAVPTSSYLPFAQFQGVPLGDGDHVDFRSDAVQQTIAVTVQVTQPVPSVFVLPRTATLQDVLGQIPQTSPTADYRSVYLLRRSVAAQQKTELTAALLRLQQDALAATALNVAAQSGSAQAAGLLPQFVQAASQAVPNGQIAVYRDNRFENLRLQDGDQIVIPEKSDVVQVAGEALNPGGFAYRPGLRAVAYIRDAGGFSAAADKHRFVLKKPNGVATVIKGDVVPEPGDLVVVVPHVSGRTFLAIQSITSLLLPAAVGVAAVTR